VFPVPFYLFRLLFVPEIIMDEKKIIDEILARVRETNRCWTSGWHEGQFR
jgi:hypothetical protein